MSYKIFPTVLLMVAFVRPSLAQDRPSSTPSTQLQPAPADPPQSQPGSNAPLTPQELREGILRIEEGVLAAREVTLLKKALADGEGLSARERAVAQRELEAARQEASNAKERADAEKARGDFFENALNTVTKKTSFGCHVARVFTLGLSRCGR